MVRIHRFGEVESTNDIALEMARQGAPEGTVVCATSQTRGRGRRGRPWHDEPGSSVLLSLILAATGPQSRLHELTFVVSLALAEFLRAQYGIEACLKWPNDVMVADRKIAGILLETAHVSGKCAAVVGAGLNVTQANFPTDISSVATSLRLETGLLIAPEALVAPVAEAMFGEYQGYLRAGFEEILSRWRKYMWRAGCRAEVISAGRVITGRLSGIDETGALLLADDCGEIESLIAVDDIRFVAD